MEDNALVESSFSATINAPIEKVDIPAWCFTLRLDHVARRQRSRWRSMSGRFSPARSRALQ
jgi:hypothetical protein